MRDGRTSQQHLFKLCQTNKGKRTSHEWDGIQGALTKGIVLSRYLSSPILNPN